MRIAFLSQEIPGINEVGGIGFHFMLLAKYLVARGHQVTIFYDGEEKYEESGVKIVGIWRGSSLGTHLRHLMSQSELFSTLLWAKRAKDVLAGCASFDIIELPEFHSCPWMILPDHPTVMSLHGGKRQTAELNFDYSRYSDQFLALLEKQTVQRASVVYAVSPQQADYASAMYQRKVVRSVPNPIDTQMFTPSKKIPRVHSRPFLLFVGRMEYRKGLTALLASYVSVLQRSDAFLPDLICVGDDYYHLGPNRDTSLKEYVKRCVPSPFAQKIHYIPHLRHDELVQYYRAAEFCIFPSIEEPFGNVIAEAMSCGKVVIVSDRCGVTSWLSHGKDALITSPTPDALSRAITEAMQMTKDKKRAMERAARTTAVENFSASLVAAHIEQLYQEVSSKNSRLE